MTVHHLPDALVHLRQSVLHAVAPGDGIILIGGTGSGFLTLEADLRDHGVRAVRIERMSVVGSPAPGWYLLGAQSRASDREAIESYFGVSAQAIEQLGFGEGHLVHVGESGDASSDAQAQYDNSPELRELLHRAAASGRVTERRERA